MGVDMRLLDENGNEITEPGKEGIVALKLPGPLTLFKDYWNDTESCIAKYYSEFPGYFKTGDVGQWDENECFHLLRRIDEEIKINHKRISARWLQDLLLT